MAYKRISISTKIFEKSNHFITWINQRPVLITKYEGKYYGMDAVCGHMGCALLDIVSGNVAECPAHGAKYDVTNGNRIAEPRIRPEKGCEYDNINNPLKTYAIKENEGFLEIDI